MNAAYFGRELAIWIGVWVCVQQLKFTESFASNIHSMLVWMWRCTSACDHQKSILYTWHGEMQHQLNRSEEITIFKCITRGITTNAPMSEQRQRASSWVQRHCIHIPYTIASSSWSSSPLLSTRSLQPAGKLKKNEHAIKLLDTMSAYF